MRRSRDNEQRRPLPKERIVNSNGETIRFINKQKSTAEYFYDKHMNDWTREHEKGDYGRAERFD